MCDRRKEMKAKRFLTISGLGLCMAAAFTGCGGTEKVAEAESKTAAEARTEDEEKIEITSVTEEATETVETNTEASPETQKETTESKSEAATEVKTDTTSEAATEAEDVNKDTEEGDNAPAAYKNAFMNFVSDPSSYDWKKVGNPDQVFNWDSFQLIEIDEDEEPELIVTSFSDFGTTDGLQHYLILDNTDEGLMINELTDGVASAGGYRGTLYYIPNKSVIYDISMSAPYGAPVFTLYKSENGKIELEDSACFNPEPGEGEDPMENGSWYWGNEVVTQEEYESKLDEATESQSGIALNQIDYMDKDSIISELEK